MREDELNQGSQILRHAAALVAAIGLALTLTVAAGALISDGAQRRERFNHLADQAVLTLNSRLDAYIALLEGASAMFAASDDVRPSDFAQFVKGIGLARRYPGVRDIAFIVWLGPGASPAAPAFVRRALSPHATPAPGARSALVYLQPPPASGAQDLLGYDDWTQPAQREAMARARATGAPAASRIQDLVAGSSSGPQQGFLIFSPVYSHKTADGGEAAPSVSGWVSSAFRARELFTQIFVGSGITEEVEVEVRDGVEGPVLYESDPKASPDQPVAVSRSVLAAGRPWRVNLRPLHPPTPWDLVRRTAPILLTGLALTAAFAWATEAQARAFTREVRARSQTELMLQEVNHRVANSLQLVAGMVSLQADAVDEPAAKAALHDTYNRILAVGRVHQRLYRSGEVDQIELGDYLHHLVHELAGSLQAGGRHLSVDAPVEIAVSPDKAVAAGVAVAELVSNAAKYAYPGRDAGDIRVCLRRSADRVSLTVEDDGVGYDPKAAAKGTGLGMKVVRAMAATLGADVDMAPNAPGTRVTLKFPAG